MTRSELGKTLRELKKDRSIRALLDRSKAERQKASQLVRGLEAARHDLIATEMSDLRDGLEAHASALRRELRSMREVRRRSAEVTEMLGAASRLLKTVQRVVDSTI